ncbi:DUF881 domain-containing protein [Janibacter sp. GXQ6167]|uniref:DUF881 domain-containing protein n=1 Tax=Janibacter sp. GXQ6167 TaxID=3240791 RepID=UPI003523D3AC
MTTNPPGPNPPDDEPTQMMSIRRDPPQGDHQAAPEGGEAPADERPPVPPATPLSSDRWRRLYLIARPRATRANFFALALACLLGFAIATQVRQTQAMGLEDLRQDELVRILDDVTKNGSRLDDEITDLERTRSDLVGSQGDEEQAARAAQERLDALGILAGTSRASGPGITLTITDPQGKVTAATLLDTLQELRDAGAEAIQVGNVRLVAASYFTDRDGTVLADGKPLRSPYVFTVIGNAQTMSTAMEIPGGVGETVRGLGGRIAIEQFESVNVDALHELSSPRYAQPVPEPSPDGSR